MADWTEKEVEIIIAVYFQMLSFELTEKPFSKAVQRRNLLPLLNNRSEGSIEFKHQNISAVLINLGQPYIKGYLPRFNYQKILEEKVIDFLKLNMGIENQFKSFADKEIVVSKAKIDFKTFIVDPPKIAKVFEPTPIYHRNPIKVNYLEREQSNSKLGKSGEELVLQFEKWRLISNGMERFAEQVRWVSQEDGDGAGFDILSKNTNGTDKYIEVKTTKLGKETPFFFSRNELLFSTKHSNDFHLFRLFNFENEAKMFIKNGSLDIICHSIPLTFKGFF